MVVFIGFASMLGYMDSFRKTYEKHLDLEVLRDSDPLGTGYNSWRKIAF